ncbi:hypothetical protein PhCBS80983_g04122 [Powellomyces hirtus]|uniref:Uncharacterized protein n=1 Tax=Powellomyces hirtus TaxID=109895 RepID=A0A507DZV8_9FUNG|nr:hypothetical protein PhCBS80983_g04122 [Powellomyces hirtus]
MSIKVEVKWGVHRPEEKFFTMPLVPGMMAKGLFISDLPRVLIVGESENFTFTAAFAALRRSINNIVTTTLEDLEPDWSEAVTAAIRWAKKNKRRGGSLNDTTSFSISEVRARYDNAFETPPAVGPTFISEVDARELHENPLASIRDHCGNIFFQCPYRVDANGDTAKLIVDFMSSAALVQNEGDKLYIGITTEGRYAHAYNLRELIQDTAPEENYEFEGADNTSIQKILDFGYKHTSRTGDIHFTILSHHVTLIFTKQASDSDSTTTSDSDSTTTSDSDSTTTSDSDSTTSTTSTTSTATVDDLIKKVESMTTNDGQPSATRNESN